MKYQAIITWPDDCPSDSSFRICDTAAEASDYLEKALDYGYAEQGKYYPVSTETREVEDKKKCCGKCGAEV